MARKSKKTGGFRDWLKRLRRSILVWLGRLALVLAGLVLLAVIAYRFFDPPMTYLTFTEERRLGSIAHSWVPMEQISASAARAVVAAEDANFCLHWGFDMGAIRDAVAEGAERGASTISQQVVKNVYLWPDRRWERKALEAAITPFVELIWSKRRILEVYMNVAEFGEGVIGVEAAAQRYFNTSAAKLSVAQGAALAAVLPNPKARSVTNPTAFLRQRARDLAIGVASLEATGRSACFED